MASKPELLRFVYDEFKTKSNNARKMTQLTVDRHGNYWQLGIYPDYPTISLTNKGKHDINVTISIILRDAKGSVAQEQRRGLHRFKGFKKHNFLFLLEWSKIINREDKILNGEDLVIDVEIQHVDESHSAPPNPFSKNVLKLLDDEDSADVLFDVQGTRIFAHKVLLQANAPVLAGFSEKSDKSNSVAIHNTSPTIFRLILRYVYGGEIPSVDLIEKQGLELLGAANTYNVAGLKIAVESLIVKSGVVGVSTVVDYLLFADANTCPLLKEHCLAYFIARADDIFKTKSVSKLSESGKMSFMVLGAVLNSNKNLVHESDDEDHCSLSVEQLRRKLFKKGIVDGLDGSKKMLVARLREQMIIERGCSTV